MKVKLKLRNEEDIREFVKVKTVYWESGYLIIISKNGNNERIDPVDISLIDYYEMID